MALTDDGGNGMVMPVTPMGNNNGGFGNFGGDGWWIILLLLLCGNGWGGGFGGYGGGMGALAADGAVLYPWMNQAEITTDGFREQMLNGNINSIRDGIGNLATQICGATGDIQNSLCNGFAGVNATINSTAANAETAANARQIANMQQAFAAQTAMAQGFNQLGSQFADCCCENRLGIADLKYTTATEACATRTADAQNTNAIIEATNRTGQAILDKLCQLELDGVKAQVEAKNDRIVDLQNQLNMASFRASQADQNALFANGLNAEVDALYNRLKNCPVNTVPVYGNQPIFTCPNSGSGSGCGCGCSM